MDTLNLFSKLLIFTFLVFQCSFLISANLSSSLVATTTTEKSPTKDELLETSAIIPTESSNCSNLTCNGDSPSESFPTMGSLLNHKTAFIVLTSATLFIVVFFIIKFVRMRRKNSKTKRKYDKGSSRGTSMEMKRLEEDDEEDDWTVFDATQGKLAQTR